jgi:hypothetical protein
MSKKKEDRGKIGNEIMKRQRDYMLKNTISKEGEGHSV